MTSQATKRQSINPGATRAMYDALPFPDRYPSWTAVGVTQLALPELCVEIRAVAVVGCEGASHG